MKRALLIGFALALVALLLWRVGRSIPHAPWSRPSQAISTSPNSQPSTLNSQPTLDRSPLAEALNSPSTDIRADLRLVSVILDTFRSNFPRVGNPTGNNAEITAALTGRNQLCLSLIPPDHPALNARGELSDRWGTPFFFHAESATQMEIRSAGPDRRHWTDDDVVLLP